jgi:hypothetical protein
MVHIFEDEDDPFGAGGKRGLSTHSAISIASNCDIGCALDSPFTRSSVATTAHMHALVVCVLEVEYHHNFTYVGLIEIRTAKSLCSH